MNKVIRVIDNHYYVNLISVDTLFQKMEQQQHMQEYEGARNEYP